MVPAWAQSGDASFTLCGSDGSRTDMSTPLPLA